MEKLPVDVLIEGLEEWNRIRNTNKAQDYLTLLMIINSDLGNDLLQVYNDESDIEDQLNLLKSKVIELSDEKNVNQVMLVEGIVTRITRFFRNSYKATLNNLIIESKFKDDSDIPEAFKKFKTTEYFIGIGLDEKAWEKIVASKFSNFSLEQMDDQILIKKMKKLKTDF